MGCCPILGGLSPSLLILALIATWYTMHGRQPFPHASMAENILSLQILFCVVAVPLMFLSAVMVEAGRTQESLRRMSGNLIEAQEQERRRIAHELHDNLGQELALVKVTLDRLIEESDECFKPALTDLSNRLSAVSNTTREISHGLYPTQLEYLGLQKAMNRLCDEVQRSKNLLINLKIGNVPNQLPSSASLCLYRVAQETLHNVIKHSQAKNVQVELSADDGQILLRIIDDGVGFDLSHEVAGLGLASMRQRVRVVGGSIDISSSLKRGTRIEVRVPIQKDDAGFAI